VCYGAVSEFAPEVWPILLNAGVNPNNLCHRLGFCSANNKSSKKSIKASFDPDQKLTLSSKDTNFYVLQLSDIHFDEFYTIGAIAECDEPLCCRPWSQGNANRTAAKWGDYECDLTFPMFEAMLNSIANLSPQPNIIVWTGDNTAHDIWNETRDGQLARIKKVSQVVAQYLPNIPVFPIIGNHDTFPVDQFNRKPMDFVHYDDFTWLLNGLVSAWSTWLPGDALETLQTGGYYSALAAPGLRVIGLNTQWGDNLNFYLLLEENQQQTQFDWLSQTLQSSATNGEKVILIGHIPSGGSILSNYTTYAIDYVKLVNKFKNIIVGQFFGHTHDDQFEVVMDDSGNATSVIYIAPSVTTFTNHNPAYRIYEYNQQFQMLDYHQFIANLTLANQLNKPSWFLEYSASSEYSLKDMTPLSFLNLVKRFEADDALFKKWLNNFNTRTGVGSCTGACKKGFICGMLSATVDLSNACML